jgi:hypothetical protein
MSLISDVLATVKTTILIDEHVQRLSGKLDRLGDEVRQISTRLTRVETIIEIARPDGAVLRIAPEGKAPRRRGPRARAGE